MTTLRDILNRARWATGNLHDLEITVVHRGAPLDRRAIAGSRVVAVLAGGIEVSPDETSSETMFIPYHRFLSIHGTASVLLWDKELGAPLPLDLQPHVTVRRTIEEQSEEGVEVAPTFSVVLSDKSGRDGLVIDGSAGEGGGQILRTALCLSMITGTPFTLERIRAGRKKPGLMRQHLTCVKAAAAVSNAEIEGAALGSARLVFKPRTVQGGEYELDIGSAGSVALVLQTIALPLALAREPSRVLVRGGTHAQWAPIVPFLEAAWLPMMRRAGADISLVLHKLGFYPAGGGEIMMHTTPTQTLRALHVAPPRGPLSVEIDAIVSGLPEGIARRELTTAAELLRGMPTTLRSATVRSPGPGNAMWITARSDDEAAVTNVFSAIGDPGISAEQVGSTAAEAFLHWQHSNTSIEEHLADQVMLPIAVAGEGSYTSSALSLHARTNIEVIHAFTGHRLRAWELSPNRFRIALQGV